MSARARPKNTVSRFVVNSLSSGAATLIKITVFVWVNQYLLRRIGADEYALIPIVTALMIFVELFRDLFAGGLPRFLVEADTRGDEAEVTRIVSSMMPILFGVSLVMAIAGAVLVWQIDAVIQVQPDYVSDARIMLSLLFAFTCLRVATIPISSGLMVRMHFVALNLIQLGVQVLRVAILFVLLFDVSTRAMWLIVATTAAGSVGVAIQVGYTLWLMPAARFSPRMMTWSVARRLMSFSIWTMVQGISTMIRRSAPVLLLNQHASSVDVAAFHLGNLPDVQLRRLLVAFEKPAKPALTAIYALKGAGALQELYYRGGRYYLWATLFLLPPALIFVEELITLYVGGTYLMAAPVLISILGVYPFVWASAMFFQVAYAIGRIAAFNIANIVLCVVAIAALYVSVVELDLGVIGAAWALGGSFLVVHLFVIWPLGLRLVQGSWATFLKETVLRGLAPFGAALLACKAVASVMVVDTWIALGEVCFVSASVYAVILFGFCLTGPDRDLLQRGIRRLPIGRFRTQGKGMTASG